jgi:Zn ribbon nucleic-acid-binding protein
MKETGTCPKCKSQDIIRVLEKTRPYNAGDNIQTGWSIGGLRWFNITQVTRYICSKCGFVEEWIDSPEDIEKLKEKFGSTGNTA